MSEYSNTTKHTGHTQLETTVNVHLAGGNTATWVWLGDLHNLLLSAKVLTCAPFCHLLFLTSGSGLNHKLQQQLGFEHTNNQMWLATVYCAAFKAQVWLVALSCTQPTCLLDQCTPAFPQGGAPSRMS